MSHSSSERQGLTFGVILGVLGLILALAVVFTKIRKRRPRQQGVTEKASGPFRRTVVLSKEQAAAKIVPFGTPVAEDPPFRYPPGESMRLAIRRPDGGWDFTHPGEPFTPSGVSDIHPSPASSTTNLKSNMRSPKSAVLEYKEQESIVSRVIRLGYDARDSDLALAEGPLPRPPPAYGHEPTIGPYITYRLLNSQISLTRNAPRQD